MRRGGREGGTKKVKHQVNLTPAHPHPTFPLVAGGIPSVLPTLRRSGSSSTPSQGASTGLCSTT